MSLHPLSIAIDLGDSYLRCAIGGVGIKTRLLSYAHHDNSMAATKVPSLALLSVNSMRPTRFAFAAQEDETHPIDQQLILVQHLRRLLVNRSQFSSRRIDNLAAFLHPGDVFVQPTPEDVLKQWLEHLLEHVLLPAANAYRETHVWNEIVCVLPPRMPLHLARSFQCAWNHAILRIQDVQQQQQQQQQSPTHRSNKRGKGAGKDNILAAGLPPSSCTFVSDTSAAALICLQQVVVTVSPNMSAATTSIFPLTVIVSSGSCTTSFACVSTDCNDTGVCEVLHTDSHHDLGGLDVDNVLTKHLLDEVVFAHGDAFGKHISFNTHILASFRAQCRRLKHMMCPNGTGEIEPRATLHTTLHALGWSCDEEQQEDYSALQSDIVLTLTSAVFQHLLEPLCVRLDAFLDASMHAALIRARTIDPAPRIQQVALIGGNMQLPLLRKRAVACLERHPELTAGTGSITWPGKGVVAGEYIREPSEAFAVLGAAQMFHGAETPLMIDHAPFDLALVTYDKQSATRTYTPLFDAGRTLPLRISLNLPLQQLIPPTQTHARVELVSGAERALVFRHAFHVSSSSIICQLQVNASSHLDTFTLDMRVADEATKNTRASPPPLSFNLWLPVQRQQHTPLSPATTRQRLKQ
jgi:hypothetical protein